MRKYTDKQVGEAIKSSSSWNEVMRKVGLKPAGGNAKTMKRIALENGFDTSHFLGLGHNLGKPSLMRIDPSEIFVKDGRPVSNSTLKRHAIKESIVPYFCQTCNLKNFWNGQKLVLHLDHINGDKRNNDPSNLRFLCPNCHSQTPTYCKKATKEKKKCNICKSAINKKSSLCKKCSNIRNGENNRKIKRPSKKVLEGMIDTMTWTAIGRHFGVSDNAVRKWARTYQIIW